MPKADLETKVFYGEYTLEHWVRLILRQNIILPDYQRYFVWSEEDVKEFINSLKDNQFVPPVIIGVYNQSKSKSKSKNKNEPDKKVNIILDGQQRLTSLLLAACGLYPDKVYFQKKSRDFIADENDDDHSEDIEVVEKGLLDWTFKELLKKGKTIDKIKEASKNIYKPVNFEIEDEFWKKKSLGFCYIVLYDSTTAQQLSYYSQVFRRINTSGMALSAMESRRALYFLDTELKQFFEPDFTKKICIIGIGKQAKYDYVRALALVSQYIIDPQNVASGYYKQMENYYEEFVDACIRNTSNSKFAKFSDLFPNRKYKARQNLLEKSAESVGAFKNYNYIIEADMYWFGLIYCALYNGKSLDKDRIGELKEELEEKIYEFKNDEKHSRTPSAIHYLRARLNASIEIYSKYFR